MLLQVAQDGVSHWCFEFGRRWYAGGLRFKVGVFCYLLIKDGLGIPTAVVPLAVVASVAMAVGAAVAASVAVAVRAVVALGMVF